MKRTNWLLVAFLWVNAIGCYADGNNVLYVSPKGDDRNAGTLSRPLKTIGAALGKMKEITAGQQVEVVLRGGIYEINATLEVNRDHVFIHPYQDEVVTISGGKSVTRNSLKPVKEQAALDRLQPQVRSLIREIDFKKNRMELVGLHATGFGRPSQVAWTEIFVDGQPLRIARWPNDSTVMIGKIQESGVAKEGKEAPFPVFGYQEERPSSWKSVENMWISGYFAHGYADDMICVESIDTIHKMIHTGQHTVYGFMTGAPWRQWFALNLLEELDVPGEYVIDAGRGKMYVYPPAGKMENWSVSLLEGPLMAIEHCKDVKVQGITFEYGRHIGIYMENTHRALIKNCIIRNMGGVGVSIGKGTLKAGNQRGHESGGNPASRVVGDLMGTVYQDILFNREGGTENGVVDCHIYNVGAGGISLGGGDRASLTPAGNYVENCRIHDYNRIEKSYRPGIWMDGVGNRISKCDIYDAPSMAILFHGNNHVIELCDITNVCSEVDDQGAVYYGRDPSEQGNVIRYCYFHELSPRHRVTATYHDDGACGAEVYGNIYYKAGSLPVLIGGGHNNHYRHNIFIDSPVAIHIDARMQGWGKFMIEKGAIIDQRLQTVNYKNPPYSTAYPLLAEYWDNDTSYPKGNVIEGNLFYNIGNVVRGRTEWLELYNNWAIGSDPGFVDAADPLKGFKDDALIYQRINGFPSFHLRRSDATYPNERV